MVRYVQPGKHLARGNKFYLTLRQAEVLVAVAAHWLVFKRSPKLLRIATLLRVASSTVGACVNSLIRRGFLHARWELGASRLKEIVHIEPTAIAWAELGERAPA